MKEGNTITFTVRDVVTEGFSEIFGVIDDIETPAAYADGSTTEVVAVFSATGIPQTDSKPYLIFVMEDDGNGEPYRLRIEYNEFVETTPKEFAITSSSFDSCSFAGGCSYQINAEGIAAMLLNKNNCVDVCGNECVLQTDNYDSTVAYCTVPHMATDYSVENYKITETKVLKGTEFPNDFLTDGDLTKIFKPDYKKCEFGTTMKPGHIGVLD